MRRNAPTAFDQWVKLVLKDQFGQVVREPIPDDLLRLVEGLDREH